MEVAELVLKYIDTLVWPLATVALVWALRESIKRAIARLTRVETPAGTMEFSQEAREILDEAVEIADSSLPPQDAGGRHERGQEDADSYPSGEDRRSAESAEPADEVRRPRAAEDDVLLTREAMAGILANSPSSAADFLRALRGAARHGVDRFGPAIDLADRAPAASVLTAWAILEEICLTALREKGIEVPQTPSGKYRTDDLHYGLLVLGVSKDARSLLHRMKRLVNYASHRPETVELDAARDFVAGCRVVAAAVYVVAPDALSGTPGPP